MMNKKEEKFNLIYAKQTVIFLFFSAAGVLSQYQCPVSLSVCVVCCFTSTSNLVSKAFKVNMMVLNVHRNRHKAY